MLSIGTADVGIAAVLGLTNACEVSNFHIFIYVMGSKDVLDTHLMNLVFNIWCDEKMNDLMLLINVEHIFLFCYTVHNVWTNLEIKNTNMYTMNNKTNVKICMWKDHLVKHINVR